MPFYNSSVSHILTELKTTKNGLNSNEAASRLKQYGPNLVKVSSSPWWRKLLEPFLERVLRSLNKSTIEDVTVLRSGRSIKVPSTSLVVGDIVKLSEGEKVPADLRIIDQDNLSADESVLTGESLPVSKQTAALKGDLPIYEQANLLFAGSFVVSGTATAVVIASGNNTQFGSVATLSAQTEAKSPVQKKIDQLISRIVMIAGAMAIVTLGLSLLRGIELGESLRFVIALSVSAIPEGLPVAISVVLVLGMRRMAARKALVQNMRAIETVGVITTIATDKTGTLTENKLSVRETWQAPGANSLDQSLVKAINFGGNLSDPLDKALVEHGRKSNLYNDKHRPSSEIPFDQKYAISASIWHNGENFKVYLKGAPEAILRLSKLSPANQKEAELALESLTSKGYRVIALATAETAKQIDDIGKLTNHKITLEGFVGIADVLRPEAAEAIRMALAAGVSVRMITGDHAETAYQIGKSLGMVSKRDQVYDCRELDQLSDQELLSIIDKTKVFARVIPEHKYRLLKLLKRRNITAMTGDGVNDVPALSNAHVGVAMGSGSSIAKDAGDIILLDDNFKTIVDAMREGRVVISNIRRMLLYLLATNTGEVLAMLGALLVGSRLPLEPVQILWVNLVTDTSLVIPLGLEPDEKDVMKQKPQKPNQPILSRPMVVRILITATVIAALTLATYLIFAKSHGHAYAQTLAFAALVVSQWGNAFAVRSHTESTLARLRVMNRSFYIGLAISIGLQALVFLGPLGEALHIAPVNINHLIIVSLISLVAPILAADTHKAILRAKH
ncbi:hypothetical protein B7Y94_05455 [Candidatus Saccharibacteria bacterium 32-49-12]|nr:MAG: hypothetical protein B7Y94_05455 [Candidatus Saccharibacteria bacterium 32-49-12]